LSVPPEKRFASMDELLAVLSRPPRRRLVFGAAAALLAVAGLSFAITHLLERHGSSIPGCDALGLSLANVWNEGVRQKLGTTLAAAGASISSVDAALRQLDTYSASWGKTQAAACQKAQTERADQTALLELSCLGRERSELEALVQVLSQADKDIAPNAAAAADSLVPSVRCTDERALAALPKPPIDPQVRQQIEALRVRLAAVAVLHFVKRDKEAAARAAAIVEAAQALATSRWSPRR